MHKFIYQQRQACSDNSLLDIYANREHYDKSPDINMLNFVQFVTKFKLVNNKLTKLPDNVIPRIFPTYSIIQPQRTKGNFEEQLPKKPVGRLSINCWPTDAQQLANRRPTVGQLLGVCRPTVGRLSADSLCKRVIYLSVDSRLFVGE